MSQHPNEHPGPDGQNEGTQAVLPPAGVEIATPVSRSQVIRVMALLTVAFLVGALLLRVQADRIRPLDLPLPAGWEAVSADTVLAGISPQSAVRAARGQRLFIHQQFDRTIGDTDADTVAVFDERKRAA